MADNTLHQCWKCWTWRESFKPRGRGGRVEVRRDNGASKLKKGSTSPFSFFLFSLLSSLQVIISLPQNQSLVSLSQVSRKWLSRFPWGTVHILNKSGPRLEKTGSRTVAHRAALLVPEGTITSRKRHFAPKKPHIGGRIPRILQATYTFFSGLSFRYPFFSPFFAVFSFLFFHLFHFSFFFSFLRCSRSAFFGLNCLTISY